MSRSRDRAPVGSLELLSCLYLGLVPIGWSPFPANIQWADLIFVGLLAAILPAWRTQRMSLHPLDVLIIVYLGASLISFRGTSDLAQSGLAFTKQGYLALVYGVFSVLARTRRVAEHILRWYAGGMVVWSGLSVLALVAYVVAGSSMLTPLLSVGPLPGVGELARIKGPLLSPGFFCNHLTMALPILLAAAMAANGRMALRRWIAVLLVALAAFGTMTYSVVGLLGAGLASLWRAWSATRVLRASRRAALMACVIIFLVGNVIFAVSIRGVDWLMDTNPQIPAPVSGYGFQDETRGAQRLTVRVSYNPMSYALLKRVAAQAFLREPLTGVGLGTFHRETERAYAVGAIHAPYRRADPHAELLGRLAETGLVGGLSLLLLWWGIARFGCLLARETAKDSWVPRAILAGCFGVLLNSLNADVMNFRVVWVGLGLLRGYLERPA